MKRALLIVCGLAAGAHASPFVTAPGDWKQDAQRSSAQLGKMATLGHFGEEQAIFEGEVYAPAAPGITLFVTHVMANVPANRDLAARAEVDQFHRASQRALLSGSGITEDGWQERVDPDKQQIEASLTWRDRENHTLDISRLVIAGTADQLVAVTGECISRDDVEVRTIAACTNALATLDPRVDVRVALTLAPTGSEPPAKDVPSKVVQPTMQDGSRAVLPPMTISHEAPQPDRRPVYVGGGVLLLAALFWWNRRRRERFERDAEPNVEPKESDDR